MHRLLRSVGQCRGIPEEVRELAGHRLLDDPLDPGIRRLIGLHLRNHRVARREPERQGDYVRIDAVLHAVYATRQRPDDLLAVPGHQQRLRQLERNHAFRQRLAAEQLARLEEIHHLLNRLHLDLLGHRRRQLILPVLPHLPPFLVAFQQQLLEQCRTGQLVPVGHRLLVGGELGVRHVGLFGRQEQRLALVLPECVRDLLVRRQHAVKHSAHLRRYRDEHAAGRAVDR